MCQELKYARTKQPNKEERPPTPERFRPQGPPPSPYPPYFSHGLPDWTPCEDTGGASNKRVDSSAAASPAARSPLPRSSVSASSIMPDVVFNSSEVGQPYGPGWATGWSAFAQPRAQISPHTVVLLFKQPHHTGGCLGVVVLSRGPSSAEHRAKKKKLSICELLVPPSPGHLLYRREKKKKPRRHAIPGQWKDGQAGELAQKHQGGAAKPR